MKSYAPPPDPKRVADTQRRLISAVIWIIAIPSIVFTLMAFGYSDFAPAPVRRLTMQIDGYFGSPVWSILDPRQGR